MLHKGQEVASYILNVDEKSKVHIIASQWLNVAALDLMPLKSG